MSGATHGCYVLTGRKAGFDEETKKHTDASLLVQKKLGAQCSRLFGKYCSSIAEC